MDKPQPTIEFRYIMNYCIIIWIYILSIEECCPLQEIRHDFFQISLCTPSCPPGLPLNSMAAPLTWLLRCQFKFTGAIRRSRLLRVLLTVSGINLICSLRRVISVRVDDISH